MQCNVLGMVNWRIRCVGGDVFDNKQKDAKTETSGIKKVADRERKSGA